MAATAVGGFRRWFGTGKSLSFVRPTVIPAASVREMFELSRSYISGAKIIIESDGINDRGRSGKPWPPVVVCCGLAIEIGLKALLTHYKRTWPKYGNKGHDLKLLFDLLPDDTCAAILAFQTKYTNYSESEAKEKLEHESLVFLRVRYAYEQPSLTTAPAFLHDFAVALSEYISANVLPVNQGKNEQSA